MGEQTEQRTAAVATAVTAERESHKALITTIESGQRLEATERRVPARGSQARVPRGSRAVVEQHQGAVPVRLLAVLLITLCLGCSTLTDTRMTARGDAAATVRTCEVFTIDNGVETCTKMREREVVGGQGSDKLYEMVGIIMSGISIMLQALR